MFSLRLFLFCTAILCVPASALAEDAATLHAQVLELLTQGKVDAAARKAELLRARVREESGENSIAFADVLQAYGMLHMMRGELVDAESSFKRAIELIEHLEPSDQVRRGAPIQMLAAVYGMQGRTEEARALTRRWGTLVQPSMPDGIDITRLNDLDFANPDHFDELERIMKAQIAHFEKELLQNDQRLLRMLFPLAGLYIQHERCTDAEPLLTRMSHGASEAGFGVLEYGMLKHFTADCMLKGRAYAEAEQLYLEELSSYRSVAGHTSALSATALQGLVTVKLAQHRAGEALRYARELADGQRLRIRTGATGAGSLSRGPAISATRHAFDYVMASAWHAAEGTDSERLALQREAFEAAQWSVRNRAGEAVGQLGARLAAGVEGLATAIRHAQGLRERWGERDRVLLQLVTAGATAAKLAEVRREMGDIEREIAASEAALAMNFPAFQAFAGFEALGLEEAQRLLKTNEVLVLLATTEQETFLFVAANGQVRWVRADIGEKAVNSRVTALRCGLDDALWSDADKADKCVEVLKKHRYDANIDGQHVQVLPFDLERAHELYKALLGPVEDMIIGKHLLIVPSGPLTSLPFHVLVTEPPKTGIPANAAGYRAAAWLGVRQPITVLPSVASLKALRQHATESRASKPYLGIGNPLLDGKAGDPEPAELARAKQYCSTLVVGPSVVASARGRRSPGSFRALFRDFQADVALVRAEAPLPETADELCEIGRRLGVPDGEILLGARATEAALKSLSEHGHLADHRIVHFATHGALAGQLGGFAEPGLILTPPPKGTADQQALERDDGYLTASEIATFKLDADWVILSACNTAGGAGESAEALSGLARAFFYAGARALLVSHWAVGSEASVKLTTRAFAELKSNPRMGRAEAFRISMRELMEKGTAFEAHPSQWAPFVVVGEGAAAR